MIQSKDILGQMVPNTLVSMSWIEEPDLGPWFMMTDRSTPVLGKMVPWLNMLLQQDHLKR